MPERTRPRSLLVMTDSGGRYASLVFPKPTISYRTNGQRAEVSGLGFRPSDLVTATYHGAVVARAKADRSGNVLLSFPVPQRTYPQWKLVVADQTGNYAEQTLPKPTLRTTVAAGRVSVSGDGFTGNGLVLVTYHGQFLQSGRADAKGTVSLAFPLPVPSHPTWPLVVRDAAGNSSTVTWLGARR